LLEIPKEKRHHAHRLFQCLVAAIRPLRVEELAEIFAIDFHPDVVANLMEEWRPENAEDAVLSACSTLITVIENEGLRIVQFSHFSVKEFLTSDRLRTSQVGNLCCYHISLDAAHTVLARVCRAVLLQLDVKVVFRRIAEFPLAFYSADYWVYHSKYDETRPEVQGIIEDLLDPRMPYLAAWYSVWDVDLYEHTAATIEDPEPLPGTSLYYAALYGFKDLTEYLISTHGRQDINSVVDDETPLCAASYQGYIDAVRVLLNYGADMNIQVLGTESPLTLACTVGHVEVARLLLEHGASVDGRYGQEALRAATSHGHIEVVRLLLQYNNVNSADPIGRTALHHAYDYPKVIELLLEYGANINARTMTNDTPLCMASRHGELESVQTLLRHGADVSIRGERNLTPLEATLGKRRDVARLLLKHGAEAEW